MQIVFMGTPDFAVGALEALIAQGHEITAVVTQPDKAKGRSGQLQFPPVKECAVKHGIPVFQPRRIKTPEAMEELKKYPADVYIVAAFGQILSQEILDLPKYGCLNIHASLLPKYRGASPIQRVIIDGETETGVTIMQMNAGLDTGDMLYQKKIPITSEDTFETLHDKLMVLGGEAITIAALRSRKADPGKTGRCEDLLCGIDHQRNGQTGLHQNGSRTGQTDQRTHSLAQCLHILSRKTVKDLEGDSHGDGSQGSPGNDPCGK